MSEKRNKTKKFRTLLIDSFFKAREFVQICAISKARFKMTTDGGCKVVCACETLSGQIRECLSEQERC